MKLVNFLEGHIMGDIKKINDIEELAYIKQCLQMGQLRPELLKESDTSKESRSLLAKRNKAEEDRKDFIKGYEIVIKEIKQRAQAGIFCASEETGSISLDECTLGEELKKIIESSQSWKEPYEQHVLMTLSGFSAEAILNFYAIGTNLFDQKKYKESLSVFTFLSILNPSIPSFWIGKGLCYEGDLSYDKAIDEFENGIEADRSSFEPFLGIIRCCQQLKDYSRAIDLLSHDQENPAIKNEVTEALQYIKSIKSLH